MSAGEVQMLPTPKSSVSLACALARTHPSFRQKVGRASQKMAEHPAQSLKMEAGRGAAATMNYKSRFKVEFSKVEFSPQHRDLYTFRGPGLQGCHRTDARQMAASREDPDLRLRASRSSVRTAQNYDYANSANATMKNTRK